MGSCNTDPDKMKLILLAWLHLSGSGLGVFAQCDAELPSGKACGQEDFFMEADPEACSFFYDCSSGCISHMQCEPHSDGLPRVFDAVMEWCGLTQDVDCGSRPCSDPEMCATQPTRTTQTTTEDCGHFFDCDAAGNGTSPIPSTVENIGTVTGEGLTSTFSARTTHRLENQRFLISSTWAATSRSTLIVVIGQFAECVTRIAIIRQQFRTAQTSRLLIAPNWQMVITQTSITAGSTGIALGAWVNMFCVRARTKAKEWKISSTMKRE